VKEKGCLYLLLFIPGKESRGRRKEQLLSLDFERGKRKKKKEKKKKCEGVNLLSYRRRLKRDAEAQSA